MRIDEFLARRRRGQLGGDFIWNFQRILRNVECIEHAALG